MPFAQKKGKMFPKNVHITGGYTHGGENLTTLLVKYFNDLLGVQRSERSKDEVTFFFDGVVLCIPLGSKYADLQQKISPDTSCRKSETFHCSNVTTMKSLEPFHRNLHRDFFLKIGILIVKVYTKKVANIEECNFIHVPLRLLNPKQVIVVLHFTYRVCNFMGPCVYA